MNTNQTLPDSIITVYYRQKPNFLYPVVAARLGLVAGQHLSRADWLKAVQQNATHFLLLIQAETTPQN